MSSVQESVQQAKTLATLFSERATLLERLSELDGRIDKAHKGQLQSQAAPAKEKPAPAPAVAQKKRPGRPKGSKNKVHRNNGHHNGNGHQAPAQPAAAAAPAPAPAPTASADTTPSGRPRNRTSLKELIVKICARHPNGIKLNELVRKCLESGYRSTSDEKGFVQNIRTNLHSLMGGGVVVKDADKKYHYSAPQQAQSQPAQPAAPPLSVPAAPVPETASV